MYIKLKKLIIVIIALQFVFLSSCGIYKKTDARVISSDPDERVKKNMEEGRAFRLLGKDKKNSGEFDFATSNEMWRATLQTLDFIPLTTADYGGGIIITDWYNDSKTNESLKISVRFLSNEIRADALDISIFKKKCLTSENCKVSKINNIINSELKIAILKKASLYKRKSFKKYPGKVGEISPLN